MHVLEPDECFDASSWACADALCRDALCATWWDCQRCRCYGPKLSEYMVARSSLSRAVVATWPRDDIPRRLLRRSSPDVWYDLSELRKRHLEQAALEWVTAAMQ